MWVVAVSLGVVNIELSLCDRAAGPVLGIQPDLLQLASFTAQPLLVTSAITSTEGKQPLVNELIGLLVVHRSGNFVNVWITGIVAAVTVLKGHLRAVRLQDGRGAPA